MRLQSPPRLLLLAVLTVAGRAGSSGLSGCGEEVAPVPVRDPLLLAPLAAHTTGRAEPQPCAPVAGSIAMIGDPTSNTNDCCDDKDDGLWGSVILGVIFMLSTAISIFGLWTSLRPNARRAAGAEPPPSLGLPRNLGSYRIGGVPGQQYARSVGSGTPSVRSWDAEAINRSRARSGGSQRSWTSAADGGAELTETPHMSLRSMQMWVYNPPELKPVDVRLEPALSSGRTGTQLQPGNVFWVSETHDGEDGVVFLRIADGGGWVFDRLPQSTIAAQGSAALTAAGGVLCKPVDLLPLMVVPEEEKAGFKVAFKAGGPLVTAVTSQSAMDAGLRAGDRIVRVDGDWVREKLTGRAALHRAVNMSRVSGRPMVLDIFRQEEDEELGEEADNEETSAAHNGHEDVAQDET